VSIAPAARHNVASRRAPFGKLLESAVYVGSNAMNVGFRITPQHQLEGGELSA
jgi:hypothetical protein